MQGIKIVDINADNILDYGICGYKSLKREGFPEKVNWIRENSSYGLKIKAILTENDGVQGMIEYLSGEYCWRPVDAKGFMFIHCLFVGFKKKYKNKGYASLLIDKCIEDAKESDKLGVAVVTRAGSFMVGKEIFIKKGFEVVDSAPPDFELLVLKFIPNVAIPRFHVALKSDVKLERGLTIMRSAQCPYTKKNVTEIIESAKSIFGITPVIIDNKDYLEAQKTPCAFGTFCISYNENVISYHPISNRRFINIMNSVCD
ncbi:MAG: GNAT family N-acetyltransferase [Ignavibacteriaceae bacterium]|nr:GNAT family N-acetyltransferase [Ignavibacteriaceae bacterium]